MSMAEALTFDHLKRFIQHREMYEKESEKKLLQLHSCIHATINFNTVTPKSAVNEKSLLQLKHLLTISNKIYKICSICTRHGTALLFDNLLFLYEQIKTSFIIGELSLFTEARKEFLDKLLIIKISQFNDLDILARLRPSVGDFPLNKFDFFNLNLEYLETLYTSLEPVFMARKSTRPRRMTLSKLHNDVMLINSDSSIEDIDQLSIQYQQYVLKVQQQMLTFNKTEQLIENLFDFPELAESVLGLPAVTLPDIGLLTVDKSIINCLNSCNDGQILLGERQKELVGLIGTFSY